MEFNTFQAAFKAAVTHDRGQYLGKTVELPGLRLIMGISAYAPEDGEWSVSKVFRLRDQNDKSGQLVFQHQKKDGLTMRSIVTGLGEAAYIAVCDRHNLHALFALSDLANPKLVVAPMANGELRIVGGMKLEERFATKGAIAEELGLQPLWTSGEKQLADKAAADRKAKQAQERDEAIAAANAKKEAAVKLHQEKLATLLSRPKVTAFAADGRKLFGVPIYQDGEDEVLRDNTYCIRMEYEKPVKSYILRKEQGGRIRRSNEMGVFESPSTAKVNTTIVDVVDAEIDGNFIEVEVFASFEAIEDLRVERGLNSGTIVGVAREGKVDLYKVTKQKSSHIGHLPRVI